MPRLTAHQTAWILILAVAFAARIAAGIWWQSRLPDNERFFFGDSVSYWELGKAIAHGGPYEYLSGDARIFRTPGYPLMLSGLFRMFGDDPPVLAARALSALLGTAAVGVLAWWTAKLFDERTARCAGWIAALYPGGIAMGAFVLTEAPFCLLMVTQLALWSLASCCSSNRRATAFAIVGGAAGALATLVRPSWMLFTPLAALLSVAIEKPRARQALLSFALCASFAITMLPWWIRNAQVTGHFVATTLQVGASLYDGLNPAADGSSDMSFVDSFAALEHLADGAGQDQDIFEYRLDRRLFRAAVDWASAHPTVALRLAWIKFLRTWNVWPNEPSFRGGLFRSLVLLSYAPLLMLGVVGIWRFTTAGWPYVLAWLPAVYFAALHVVFVGSIRYREPAMLAWTALAAAVLTGAAKRLEQHDIARHVSRTGNTES